MSIKDGTSWRLNRTISLPALAFRNGRIEVELSAYYHFPIGTIMTIRHYYRELHDDGTVFADSQLLRVETEDKRVIHVYRHDLEKI